MKELLIDLDISAKTALYEQIYEYIREEIMGGRLSKGERLPSARLLAENLQVSRSTTDAAYAQLVSEGYLMAKRGSGYYVCDISSLYDFTINRFDSNNTNNTGTYIREKQADSPKAGNWNQYNGEHAGTQECMYSFLPGQIDEACFPYNAWRKSAKEALADLETGHRLLQAGDPKGEYPLRRAIASYLHHARGVRCSPHQLIIGAGNEYLLQILGQVLGAPLKAAMENPTYLQAYHTFCNIGCEVQAVPMDEDGIRTEEIPGWNFNKQQTEKQPADAQSSLDTETKKDGLFLVYVMPSHQFPLGAVMPLKRRLELLAWAGACEGRYIIEDDHDSEFRYKGRPIPSLQGMDREGKVIYLGTFSNSIMPSIRISYMVLPMELLAAYEKKCGFYTSTVSKIQQMTVCRFIEDGCFERHLNKMRGIYKAKHDCLLQLLKKKKWVRRIYGDRAGLHMAVELNCSLTEEEITERAASCGLLVQGMSGCYLAGGKKPEAGPVLLLGFGNLTKSQICAAAAILDRCMEHEK